MTSIIAVINQKGGVGKSTTALCLGAGLRLKGKRVLYVDLDAQGNLSYTLQAMDPSFSVLDVLTFGATAKEALCRTAQGDLLCASPALAGADALITQTGKEYRLREALMPIEKDYDFIVLDTPPALGVLTVNALTACTHVVIPAQADVYSLQGIHQLYQTIDTVKRYCNPTLRILGILLTRYSPRAVLSREMKELIEQTAEALHTTVFPTPMRESIAVKEAQASGMDLFAYAKKSNAAIDAAAFVEELLERIESNAKEEL